MHMETQKHTHRGRECGSMSAHSVMGSVRRVQGASHAAALRQDGHTLPPHVSAAENAETCRKLARKRVRHPHTPPRTRFCSRTSAARRPWRASRAGSGSCSGGGAEYRSFPASTPASAPKAASNTSHRTSMDAMKNPGRSVASDTP